MRTSRKYFSPVFLLTTLIIACFNLSCFSAQAQVAKESPSSQKSSIHTVASKHLSIGDPAPALQPAKWLKGTPVSRFEKGRFYVVEFWATWCSPCKENIPHLTRMAKKYKDQVSIIGVDIWENAKPGPGDPIQRAADFVKKQGAVMDYIVAADSPKDTVANTWMKSAGEGGIPCSFIVDKEGKIVWIGHPGMMEPILEKVVAGTYDPAQMNAAREAQMQLILPIQEAMAAKDYSTVVKRIEKATAQQPSLFLSLGYSYIKALFHTDDKKAIIEARKILAKASEGGNSSAGAYQMIAAVVASDPDLSPDAYQFGVKVLEEALQRWPKDYMYSMMKANIRFYQGDKVQALSLAKKALDVAKGSSEKSPEAIALIQRYIAQYEVAK